MLCLPLRCLQVHPIHAPSSALPQVSFEMNKDPMMGLVPWKMTGLRASRRMHVQTYHVADWVYVCLYSALETAQNAEE